ncbi:MAG: hypothetical protein BroJett029_25280 [Alphaproteobacteria bacterium]|nr:MAG: hypothetical protein BroJett029_25280 [Alphaproteobacteria bacterium]
MLGRALTAFAASLAVGAIAFSGTVTGDASTRDGIDTISGSSLRAIQAAMPEASKIMAGLDEYVIYVRQQDGVVTVTFADRETANELLGATGRIPVFTVELTAGQLQFVSLYYVR